MDPIASVAILLGAALVGGMIAHRLKQPVILGYMLVGLLVGPHAAGLVSDVHLVEVMATVGVSLLMFTLGLEISFNQLRQTGKAGLWGGITQIVLVFIAGAAAAYLLFHRTPAESVLFGLAISLSSTAVGLKILMDRGELDSVHGRIMVAILILQDVSAVVMIMAVPLLGSEPQTVFVALTMTVVKTVLFTGAAIVSGLWVLPWLMGRVGGVRSRELFLLVVLVLCSGAALGTEILGMPVIFGSFIVGLVLRETKYAHQALAEVTPLRDIFASLFFVSLGMLLSPVFVFEHWSAILLMVAAVMIIKIAVVFFAMRYFKYPARLALLAAAGLFQIGEFAFILAQSGVKSGLMAEDLYSMIIASAIITMLLSPLAMTLTSAFFARGGALQTDPVAEKKLSVSDCAVNGVVVCGYGRIGQSVEKGLKEANIPYLVVDIDPERIREAQAAGNPCVYGDASNVHVLSSLNLKQAKALVVTFPDPMSTITTLKMAREINPDLHMIVRAHRGKDAKALRDLGVVELVSPEFEASFRFLKSIFAAFNIQKHDRELLLDKLREGVKDTPFSGDAPKL